MRTDIFQPPTGRRSLRKTFRKRRSIFRSWPYRYGANVVRGFYDTKEPDTSNFGEGHEPKGEEGIREIMKKIPKFSSEAEEQKFWKEADSTEYIDWSKAKRGVFANLKPSLKTISIRLPESMIEELKVLANKRDVPYQSLLKVFLGERIEEELKTSLLRRAKA